MQGDTAIYTVKYKGAADSIVWRMAPDGLLGMDALVLNYRAKNKFDGVYFDRPVLNFGFSFSFPEKNISGMRWLGKGPYRVVEEAYRRKRIMVFGRRTTTIR